MQWTPGGLVPAGSALVKPSEDAKGYEPNALLEILEREAPSSPAATRVRKTPSPEKPAKPVNVLKLAKQRLKAVNKELKRMAQLEKERAELERLIEAAEAKPLAVVKKLTGVA